MKCDKCENSHDRILKSGPCKGMTLCNKCYVRIMRFNNTSRTRYDKNEYIEHSDYFEILMYDIMGNYRNSTFISKEDKFICEAHKFYLDSVGYARTTINKKKVRLHKLLLKTEGKLVIDHIDGNKLNNKRSNLQICSHKENIRKSKKDAGYFFSNRDGWISYIMYDGKQKTRRCKSKEDAMFQRLIFEATYFKEFSPNLDLIKSNFKALLYINFLSEMKISNDLEHVKLMCEKLQSNSSCPCIPKHLHVGEDNLCPCKDARTHKECLCKLFVKV